MAGGLLLPVVLTIVLGVVTIIAILDVGYFGIFAAALADWGGVQLFVDLAVALALVLTWMIRDARERGIALWPFVVLTLSAGSFGPLAYLIVRAMKREAGDTQGA